MQTYSLIAKQGPIYSSERKAGKDSFHLAMDIYRAVVYVLDTLLQDIWIPLLLMDTEDRTSADKTWMFILGQDELHPKQH